MSQSSPLAEVQSSLYSPADTIFAGSLQESQLSLEEKVHQVLLVCSGGELVGRDQLTKLFQEKKHPVCYDGFEPSGRMHLAQGIMKGRHRESPHQSWLRLRVLGCGLVRLVEQQDGW